ncbi:putative glyoxalase superfamily protein PhnB [Luteimonas cucumeris]|uniref:Putative glyoxalase superfamily protein PhnB n=1 Tax=Luteimonas cucumeris TaxID=985012 RepID=A0A562L5N5_9GAMM|nr:VOC family protein [Luteimonas cucumeris]TWI02997.1 putative glyoxalase superfamily protein PhnB [Luteimonas cucumeris]
MKLAHVVVYLADVEQTLDFYQRAFALPIRMKHEIDGAVAYAELDMEGTTLGFASHWLGELNLGRQYQPVSTSGKPFGQTLVFVTDDVRASLARAIAAGAGIVAAPRTRPWGQTVACIRAIEGTLIELCSPVPGVTTHVAGMPDRFDPGLSASPEPHRPSMPTRAIRRA